MLVGFAGVSIKIIATRPFRMASSAAAVTGFIDAVGKAHRADREAGKRFGKQRLGSAIERLRMQDHVARPDEARMVVAIADMPDENSTQDSARS